MNLNNTVRKKMLLAVVAICSVIFILLAYRWLQTRGVAKCGLSTKCGAAEVVEVNKKGKASLAVKPTRTTLKSGEQMRVDVVLENVGVQATSVIITYDPRILKVSDVKNGVVFTNVLSQKVEDGKITFIADIGTQGKSELKMGTVFSFTVTAIGRGTSQLKFDTKATKTALRGGNILKSASSSTILVQ
ncbi:hypothetical protein A3B02_02790 [Candidatus Roizmanbacteria bacterium RIFCSPLOWO2_01_FULL_42_14]|uniref:Cohesin domain-containing protein n=1 Tax=Candidatus Roizmanbacteria bacterium RIFCSPLOWO2_01_FULL_42_14 TaxID=1802068 RepID=A0A1F7J972_9BACT|nr:MAG: hypothetical protein A3B02_02790 [Candidatus Roizmanbacteria bacterium RIFCSPLOWO2_01_FULL_42_14]